MGGKETDCEVVKQICNSWSTEVDFVEKYLQICYPRTFTTTQEVAKLI